MNTYYTKYKSGCENCRRTVFFPKWTICANTERKFSHSFFRTSFHQIFRIGIHPVVLEQEVNWSNVSAYLFSIRGGRKDMVTCNVCWLSNTLRPYIMSNCSSKLMSIGSKMGACPKNENLILRQLRPWAMPSTIIWDTTSKSSKYSVKIPQLVWSKHLISW